jgi:hypothetical protein
MPSRPAKIAAVIMMILFILTIIFHLSVLAGLVPGSMVMGGNFSDRDQLLLAESVALFVNMVMLLGVLVYLGRIKAGLKARTLRVFFLVLAVIFFLNTAGNLAAKDRRETFIFTPITLLLAICSTIVVMRGFGATTLSAKK